MLEKFSKTKKACTYMIHTCYKRLWYVEKYLIPSMIKQGIHKEDIIVWKDKQKSGNLESFVRSMKWIAENQPHKDGIWHLQDDIAISKQFKELTEKHDKGISAGFCNQINDGGNVNAIGIVPYKMAWFSFQCIRIPNCYAGEFVDWYRTDVVPNKRFEKLRSDGKNDDALFKHFIYEKHPEEMCCNFIPNIVEHIDYLIGGSVANQQRKETRKAYWFEEPEITEELKKSLKR